MKYSLLNGVEITNLNKLVAKPERLQPYLLKVNGSLVQANGSWCRCP